MNATKRAVLSAVTALALGVGLLGGQVVMPAPAAAATGFDPGNIISDALFYDGNAMSSSQIQSFLDFSIGSCQNDRCLNVADVPVTTVPANYSHRTGNLICSSIAGGTMRVSELIYRVQVACGISAKVILVTLQKEQGLVTSRAPTDWAIRAAMGMACPDTAPCDDAYAGLATQIISGTTQLKTYMAGAFARQPGLHFIEYHPTDSCGGTNIYIQNYATAALYNYTPYQPNAASLANIGGVGDSCSSYGNRNFWDYYTSWFGSTQVPSFQMDTGPHVIGIDASGVGTIHSGDQRGSWVTPVSVGSIWDGLRNVAGVGDLDGDGHRDVIGIDSAGEMLLFPSDGRRAYAAGRVLSTGWPATTKVYSAGDWNGDGTPDLFSIDAAGDLWFHANMGRAVFKPALRIGNGWEGMTAIIAPGDYDGDGRPDVVARDAAGRLFVYQGNGRGGWTYVSKQVGTGWGGMTAVVSPGDFNGDGRVDLLARDAAGRLWLYAGAGNGYTATVTQIGHGWAGYVQLLVGGPTATRRWVAQAGAGDVNGDGARDVLALDGTGQLFVHTGNGAGSWINGGPVLQGWAGVRQVLGVGDFDGDGRDDLMALKDDGTLQLHTILAGGGIGPGKVIGWGWSAFDLVISVGDANGDGTPDIAARDVNGALWLHPGDGRGGWLGGYVAGNGWGGMTAVLGAGDWDGDGVADILARTATGDLLVYPGTGAGWWNNPHQIGVGWGGYVEIFSPGDFDGDGKPDLLARTASGELVLHSGNGTGGWRGSGRVVGWGWNIFTKLS